MESGAAGPVAQEVLAAVDKSVCNIPDNVLAKVDAKLHNAGFHPIATIKERIVAALPAETVVVDALSPVVSTAANFDSLGFPADHVSRSKSDTYYINSETVLRTHTSAHQVELMRAGHRQYAVFGDVYRRDEIDASHYPVFHQAEGVQLFDKEQLAATHDLGSEAAIGAWLEADLKGSLLKVVESVFPGELEVRWNEDYFPFTHPSWELEVLYNDAWLETLGCGIIHPDVLTRGLGADAAKRSVGWAYGLGLDRLAMILFNIPDVRLFWSTDERFHNQFTSRELVQFKPYSKYPPSYRDVSFWLPAGDGAYHVNDFYELARTIGGDLIEDVALIDEFTHPKTGLVSHCFRINYRSHDETLTNEFVDSLQHKLRIAVVADLGVELR
ncbi:phenylalanyl-tRNA synthetase class IIc family protein [Thecamonas trahens ATCC 50062]|uniref:phenylalanine--tRNA ligase n=1 Tax=Thecamonas trahens ATCC 50062 TaxID=461836 RepID=A0A0L0DG85_THETB|nr:phenylalanyl-tRNA synthetase class IIc family protein [Thecamonas trahens ATCC 50062]KNC51195.1 phenylalanyl-tRNA synthetase class IIc family protein [Thecamonas trahens ATCC 50062]|eukprot:XP_013756395.1 phenylalanyl-tRNA synthetase class IIc family protein [Thecamonas trahens ATCC 50062]